MAKINLPAPDGRTTKIVDVHNTGDIIQLVLSQDGRYLNQVDKFTEKLKGLPVYDQCKYIWQTLRDCVKYIPDGPDTQNLKSPARLFSDGTGDCKSFSLFEANCLRSLGIPYAYRFVSFRSGPTPTHVYVLANPGKKSEIIMDGVLNKFDYQKPYTFKYDVPMLNMLTGIPEPHDFHSLGATNIFKKIGAGVTKAAQGVTKAVKTDAANLTKSMNTNLANAKAYEKDPAKLAADAGKTVTAALTDAVNVVKTINPGSILVRQGILLAMNTNLLNAASKLKLGLLTPAQAQAKKYNITEWAKLQASTNKFLNDFVNTWGGNKADLIAAINKGGGTVTGCPSVKSGAIGAAQTSSIQKFIAAALPIIEALIKDFIGINLAVMTANSANGPDEKAANAPSTINTDALSDIAAGASALAAAAQSSGLLPGGPAAKPTAHAPARPVVKKGGNLLLPIGLGLGTLYFLSKSK